MSIILPKFQLKVPSETTRFRDLGKELRELGISIEAVLESFDYNGADPNLVAARVAALETWKGTTAAQFAAIVDAQVALRGTSAQRSATTPKAGQTWKDTDSGEKLWSTGPAGTWRRHEGSFTSPPAAWTGATGPIHYGRTISAVLPTALGPNEALMISIIDTSAPYAAISVAGLVKDPATTTATLRFSSFSAAGTYGVTVGWQIVQTSA